MKVFLFDCGRKRNSRFWTWTPMWTRMLEPFLFLVSYWQYDILMNTDRRKVSQVQLHIEQDAGSFWISWLSFYHNFRGVISEATQHFTSCYIKVADCSRLVFCQESSGGAGSIIRRRKDRPPCARLFVWTETGSDRVLEAVCWDWLMVQSNKDWTAQWPTSMLWLFLQDVLF